MLLIVCKISTNHFQLVLFEGLDSVGQERGSAHLLLEDHHQEAAEEGRGQDQEQGQELDVSWTMLSGLEETCQLS